MAQKAPKDDNNEDETWSGVLGALIAQTMKDITIMIKLDINNDNLYKLNELEEIEQVKIEKLLKPCHFELDIKGIKI